MMGIGQILRTSILLAVITFTLSSCGIYKRSTMFRTEESDIVQQVQEAEENYKIRPGDWVDVKVYSNDGERNIDPDFELLPEGNIRMMPDKPLYLVRHDGFVKLPLVGDVQLSGLTLYQSDSLLVEKYSEKYVKPFVVTRLKNRRVVMIGPAGGAVIPLENENMNLIEILARYESQEKKGDVTKIRLIRGDLNDPEVHVIDLSTIKGMKQASLTVRPNDVIYMESIRSKIATESFRDVAPIIGVFTSILTLVVIITR